MLFSDMDVVRTINMRFEPVWVSLRPVPIVTIDFGNGEVIKRTLHGNVATYACTPEGEVLDVLPGIYEPNTYIDRLRQFSNLFEMAYHQRSGLDVAALSVYHKRQYTSLKEDNVSLDLVLRPMASITGAEQGVRVMMEPARRIQARGAYSNRLNKEPVNLDSKDLKNWDALARDTETNETVRRLAIHQHLMGKGAVQPEQISKWLYREVLHADLDDPYLGLGQLLFDSYPFAEEDR